MGLVNLERIGLRMNYRLNDVAVNRVDYEAVHGHGNLNAMKPSYAEKFLCFVVEREAGYHWVNEEVVTIRRERWRVADTNKVERSETEVGE